MNVALFYIYLLILGAATLSGFLNYKKLDGALKIIWLLIAITFAEESIIKFFIKTPGPKYICYHIYSIIELSFTSLFFINSIGYVKKHRIIASVIFIILWTIAGVGNIAYLQDIRSLNSNILLLESFAITAMAMIALYKMLLSERIVDVLRHPYFIIWSILLVYWSSSYFYWAFIGILYRNNWHYPLIDAAQTVLNIAEYAVIGFAFSIQPKWAKSWT